MKEPKDLDVKIGTKTEAFWTDFKKRLEEQIFKNEEIMKADKHLLKFAKEQIKKENAS